MKLVLKQKILSWFNSYNIYDEYDNIVYTIKGELSWGHKLKIYDKNNIEVGVLKEKVLAFLPKFYMYDNYENELGVISKKLSFVKPKYELSCNDWKVKGDFWEWNYQIVDSVDNKIAVIQKKFNLADNYIIDISKEENALLVLMIILAIDIDKENNAIANAASTINP